MPVYNGENFLAEAIASVLSQTYEDLELVICDNASTDETQEICRDFAAKDERVVYLRNRKNIGGGPNNNRVFELSRGQYFKIANHDDVCHPDFLRLCVETLDGRPDAVCAYPLTTDIDSQGAVVAELPRTPGFAAPEVSTRVWEALRFDREPQALFGVMRADVVARTGLMPSVPSADRVWLAELLMHGPFVEVPRRLFLHREHPMRSTYSAGRGHASMAWWDPSMVKVFTFPYWRMFGSLMTAIHRSPLSPTERMSAYRLLLRWTATNRHHLKLIYDLAIPLRPVIDRLYRD
jgi:glycosyltransferase involved in cell wall biosynthesis